MTTTSSDVKKSLVEKKIIGQKYVALFEICHSRTIVYREDDISGDEYKSTE
jgi:hypothetical protein